MTAGDAHEVVLRSPRRRWAAIGAIDVGFAAFGIRMTVAGEPFGWLVAGFFGLCTAVSARCGEFEVWRIPIAPRRMVTFVYDGGGTRVGRLNRRLGARSHARPDTFGVPPAELCAWLNERRQPTARR